jgi:hypothetical protein
LLVLRISDALLVAHAQFRSRLVKACIDFRHAGPAVGRALTSRSHHMKFLLVFALLFTPALLAQGIGVEFDIAKQCLKLADGNKDGVITTEEARKLRTQYIKELRKAAATKGEAKRDAAMENLYIKYDSTEYVVSPYVFTAIDKDKDGKVSKAELQTVEEEDYEEIGDEKRLKAVAEEEWLLLLEAFGEGKKKLIDAAALRAMTKDDEFNDGIQQLLHVGIYAMAEVLHEFEDEHLREELRKEMGEEEGDEIEDNAKDLSKVKVEKADYDKMVDAFIKSELAEAKGSKKEPAKEPAKQPEGKDIEKEGKKEAERKKD